MLEEKIAGGGCELLPFSRYGSNVLPALLHQPHRGPVHEDQLIVPREDESLGVEEAGLGPPTAVPAAVGVAGQAGLSPAQVHLVASISCSQLMLTEFYRRVLFSDIFVLSD